MDKSKRNRRLQTKRRSKFPLIQAEPLEQRCMLAAANLVISEFMASNKTALKDAAGDYPDWIEIHNAGDAAANLNDYFLTDNAGSPEEWRFPVQTLGAGGYLVVFADSTNTPPVANTELHTNFSLSASGEYLGLINASDDSVQFEYAPTFPAQSTDVSYGLANSDDPNSARVFFSVPTPGAANVLSTATPTFSTPGKVFTGTLSVSLSDSTPGAVIHYTTDNSLPTASSPTYTSALSLTASTPIRAIAFASGYMSSPVTSQTYERVDSTVTSVTNTNLPIVIIDTYGGTLNQTTDIGGSATFMNSTGGTTNLLTGTADYQGRIGMHIRGSTSVGYPKQQYTINPWDESNGNAKVSLFGMPSDSSWVLYAPYTELSLMQNPLAYKWANEAGHYASKTQFVEVYMSTGGNTYAGNTSTINYTSNYMGIYILEEKVKADSNRVDIGNEISSTNPNGGFLIEQDRYSGQDYFTTPQGVHLNLEDPDDTSLTSAISGAWDAFENALFTGSAGANQPWDTPGNPNYYGNYIDVNSFVDYFIVDEMTRNIDSFWLSTYYSKSSDTGLISAGPVWDFNLAMGAPNYNFGSNSAGWDTDTLSPYPGAAGVSGFNPQDPYFQRLLTDPNFVQAISDRWSQLRQGVFSTSNLMADIDANVSVLSDNTGSYPVGINPTSTASPVTRNFQKWPELGVYVTTDGMYDPAGSWIQDVNLMKNWLTGRVNWMDSQFIASPTVTPGGEFVGPVSVSMTPHAGATLTDTQLIGPNSTVYYKVPTASISGWQTFSATSQPSGWSTGTTGLGYDTTTTPVNFLPYISTNVQSAMYNHHADIFTLMNFNISDPSAIQALILKVQYDDGYTAWINGVRVADANTPENNAISWNTNAAGSGDDTQAITYREYDVTSIKSLLHAGNNTLAIQGMNSGSGSEDFLLSPTLYSRTYTYPTTGTIYYTTDGTDPRTTSGGISSSALVYSGALSLSSSTRVEARTYVNGTWSALADESYDLVAQSLRVSELMYDPPVLPGDIDTQQNYEFVEVQNISSSPLDLSGYAFTNGVTFTFPDTTLAPGAFGVVVHNLADFQSRYGTGSGINVLGVYSGSFNNSGEEVTLSDNFGNAIEDFTYSPSWYPQTAGSGGSLVPVDVSNTSADMNQASSWRASHNALGSPGADDNDVTPPTIQSTAFNASNKTLTVTFSENVTLSAGMAITEETSGATITPTGSVVSGSTLTISLSSSLSDGLYQLLLPADSIKDASGNPLAADAKFSFLFIANGDTWSMPTGMHSYYVNQLAIGTGSTLDMTDNALAIANGDLGTWNGSAYTGLTGMIQSGEGANHQWNGVGIVTSTSQAASGNAGIGIGSANAIFGLSGGSTVWDGLTVTGTDVLLRYTFPGDANLDGLLNGDDYFNIDSHVNQNGSVFGYYNGDFNYDGRINGDDYFLIDSNINSSGNNQAQSPAALAGLFSMTTIDKKPDADASTNPNAAIDALLSA